MIIGVRGDIAIKRFGPDLDNLNQYAGEVEAVPKTILGNRDVYTVQNDGVQYLRVLVDRLQAGRLGLAIEKVQDALRTQIERQQAGSAIEGNRRTPIVLRADEAVRTSPAAFGAIRITGKDGTTVALSSIAKLERAAGPVKIDREMDRRYNVVIANVSERDLVGFIALLGITVLNGVVLVSYFHQLIAPVLYWKNISSLPERDLKLTRQTSVALEKLAAAAAGRMVGKSSLRWLVRSHLRERSRETLKVIDRNAMRKPARSRPDYFAAIGQPRPPWSPYVKIRPLIGCSWHQAASGMWTSTVMCEMPF